MKKIKESIMLDQESEKAWADFQNDLSIIKSYFPKLEEFDKQDALRKLYNSLPLDEFKDLVYINGWESQNEIKCFCNWSNGDVEKSLDAGFKSVGYMPGSKHFYGGAITFGYENGGWCRVHVNESWFLIGEGKPALDYEYFVKQNGMNEEYEWKSGRTRYKVLVTAVIQDFNVYHSFKDLFSDVKKVAKKLGKFIDKVETLLKNSESVAKINENQKVTLTLKQLKRLVRESNTVSEDEGDEPERYIDDWLMPDQLTDEEFTDFTYFVDGYTGTEDYSNYKKKMPEYLFNELYDMWLTKYEKEHSLKPYKDRTGEDPFEGV